MGPLVLKLPTLLSALSSSQTASWGILEFFLEWYGFSDQILLSRRPSSWLPPTVSVLALVKRGTSPETPPVELVKAPAHRAQTDR